MMIAAICRYLTTISPPIFLIFFLQPICFKKKNSLRCKELVAKGLTLCRYHQTIEYACEIQLYLLPIIRCFCSDVYS